LSPAANRQGVLAMLLAMSAFIGSDTLMKIATGALPPGEIMAVRGLFATLITLGLVGAAGEFRRAKRLRSPLVVPAPRWRA
jgi:drug/metabolite transporter (DMT)-like permease